MQCCSVERIPDIVVRGERGPRDDPDREDGDERGRCPYKRGIPASPQDKGGQDGGCEDQRAFMGEDEREQNGENRCSATDAGPCVMTDGESRPEQGMRDPHFGGETENERAQASGREASVNKNDAPLGAIGCKGCHQPKQRRDEKHKTIDIDRTPHVLRDFKIQLRRDIGEDVNEQTSNDVMPVECPGVSRANRVRKHGTISIHLQLIMQPDNHKDNRPANPCGYREGAQHNSC
jgi:hypothetical protein